MIDWSFEQVACDAVGIDINELRPPSGKSSKKKGSAEATIARYLCFMHLHKYTMFGYSTIGKRYYKDHATVLSGLNKIREWTEIKDIRFLNALNYFLENVNIDMPSLPKLSDEQMISIRLLYKEGVDTKKIATYYNVNNDVILSIVKILGKRNGRYLTRNLEKSIINTYVKTNISYEEMSDKYMVDKNSLYALITAYKKNNGKIGVKRNKLKDYVRN